MPYILTAADIPSVSPFFVWLRFRGVFLFCPPRIRRKYELFPTLVYILQKNIWDEKRYTLSTDILPEKVKTNPIIEAKKIEALITKNSSFSKARIAKVLQMSRARITQMLNLLKIAPEIQEQVLQSKDTYTERQLRPLTRLKCFEKQRQLFHNMSTLSPVLALKQTFRGNFNFKNVHSFGYGL